MKSKIEGPCPLLRTAIDEFILYPRSFVLKLKYCINFPSIPPLTLAVATDHLLKNEFDKLCKVQSSEHWLFKRFGLEVVPYEHPEIDPWRNNFKGIRYLHECLTSDIGLLPCRSHPETKRPIPIDSFIT